MCWCCGLPSGGPTASGWVPAGFSNYFWSPSSIEGHAARKQIDTQFSFSGFASQKNQGLRLPRKTHWILTRFNEKWAVTSLSHFPGPFESVRSLKGTDAARSVLFIYLYNFFTSHASSYGVLNLFRLEILTSGLINTINYCWLMKTYGHGWLAVSPLGKDAFHQHTGRNCYSLQEFDWSGLLHCNSAWR